MEHQRSHNLELNATECCASSKQQALRAAAVATIRISCSEFSGALRCARCAMIRYAWLLFR